jgi:hypothetical protein
MKRLVLLTLATALWLPLLHHVFAVDHARLAQQLAARQARVMLADASPDRAVLRRVNPEWDLMSRTFVALAFTNLALTEPARAGEHLAVADAAIEQTLRDERMARDQFVLPYFNRAPLRDPAGRSLFVDGELALMLAARQLVSPRADFVAPLRERVDLVTAQFERAPLLLPESYPDEGWTFCNSIALAALTLSDRVDGRDHSALRARWLASAKAHLVDPRTGLLVSSFTFDGVTRDGPEGSTLWLSAHMLQLVDADFAQEQYERARKALIGQALGFAWAAEWPVTERNVDDVDSGPTIPFVNANAGSSGLALVGAGAFDDATVLDQLVTSLQFAAFPQRDGDGLRFAAGNQLADAVLLYSLVEGPLWQRAASPTTREAHR